MEERVKQPLLGMTLSELSEVVKQCRMPDYKAKQLAHWIYVRHVFDINDMTNLSINERTILKEKFTIGCMPHAECQHSKDGTIKYLFPTLSGQFIETVYIPDGERATLCVSCQVGCRMGCKFCMTGRQGFHGNLTTTDILNQIYSLPERDRLTNVVFMGQGEPMDNIDAVMKATKLLTDSNGYAWSPKRITVSTVGVKKGLERYLKESECHLAISLHNPFTEERLNIMPAEKTFGIKECIETLQKEDWTHQRRISFEYIVFRGLNDSLKHAKELVRLLSTFECRVNLIRFHDIPNTPFKGTSEEKMIWLRDYLTKHGITTTIRASRGQDIYAACGLLSTEKNQTPHN